MLQHRVIPLLWRTTFAGLIAVSLPMSSASAGEVEIEYEEVVFRVTLQGPVPPTHTFAVLRGCEEVPCVTESIVINCSPPNEFYDYELCTAKTYEFTSMIEAGLTVKYGLLRWTTPDLAHTADQPEELLPGSWTVQDGRQVISLGYVYPGQTGGGLPDTAMSAP